jgi:transcriptional regulator with XRE-family HTH domain
MAKRSFDAAAFFAALDAQRRSTKKTWKQVAGEAGLSASTLTRLAQGHRPDIDGLASLLSWSGLDAETFIRDPEDEGRGQPETLARISTYLRADPQLSPTSANAMERIIAAAYEQLREEPDETSTGVQDGGARDRT